MKRPFVAVVSCYAIGLLLAGIFRPPLVALFGTAFVVLVLACRADLSRRSNAKTEAKNFVHC